MEEYSRFFLSAFFWAPKSDDFASFFVLIHFNEYLYVTSSIFVHKKIVWLNVTWSASLPCDVTTKVGVAEHPVHDEYNLCTAWK